MWNNLLSPKHHVAAEFLLAVGTVIAMSSMLLVDMAIADDVEATTPKAEVEAVKNPSSSNPGKASKSGKPGQTATKSPVPRISEAREAAAIAFAVEHHAELSTLLTNLKQTKPAEYHAAIADIDRIVGRLDSMKAKNPAMYDHELSLWKLDSRIRLMVARLTMTDNPALEVELKKALREKLQLTLSARQAERDRLQKRVDRLDESIGELEGRLDDAAEKEFVNVKRSITVANAVKSRSAKKGDANSASKPDESRSGLKKAKEAGGAVLESPARDNGK